MDPGAGLTGTWPRRATAPVCRADPRAVTADQPALVCRPADARHFPPPCDTGALFAGVPARSARPLGTGFARSIRRRRNGAAHDDPRGNVGPHAHVCAHATIRITAAAVAPWARAANHRLGGRSGDCTPVQSRDHGTIRFYPRWYDISIR